MIIAAMIVSSLSTCAVAQTYHVDWQSINAGGGPISGGAYRMTCTIGQSTAGFAKGTSLLHWAGFWSGDVPTPTVAPALSLAKQMADGACISVSGKIATSAAGDFANFFYIEESERYCGIRVAASPASVSGLARGSVVNVIGNMDTLPSGERQIAGPIVVIASTASPLTPVGMPGRTVGGGNFGTLPAGQSGATGGRGVNNVGLLIKTWGQVTATGAGYVEIDDGSGVVTVDTSTLASPPSLHSYVSVIGISSLYESEGSWLRLVLPRRSDDVEPY